MAAYYGDLDGDGRITQEDAQLVPRVVVSRDTGFAVSLLVDPVLLGDINGSGKLESQDGTRILQEANWYTTGATKYNRPEIPDIPDIPDLSTLGEPTVLMSAASVATAEPREAGETPAVGADSPVVLLESSGEALSPVSTEGVSAAVVAGPVWQQGFVTNLAQDSTAGADIIVELPADGTVEHHLLSMGTLSERLLDTLAAV